MYKVLKNLYIHGKISAEKLNTYVPKWITEEEYSKIIGLF